jgi:hypothetical protein
VRADERLVDKLVADRELAACVQLGKPGRRAGAARRAIKPAGTDHHGVLGVLRSGSRCEYLHVAQPANSFIQWVDRGVRGVDRGHNLHAGVDDPGRIGPVKGHAQVIGAHDGVEVAAESDVISDCADPGHVDDAIESDDEGLDIA